jgi:hypothetical protein
LSSKEENKKLKEENKRLDKKYKNLKESIGEMLNFLSEKDFFNDPGTKEMILNLKRDIEGVVDENKKMKEELEEFRPLFDNKEPVLVGSKSIGEGGSGDV